MQLRQELENKDEDITELQEKLSKEQKASHYLSANLSLRKQETHELHRALEQVFFQLYFILYITSTLKITENQFSTKCYEVI